MKATLKFGGVRPSPPPGDAAAFGKAASVGPESGVAGGTGLVSLEFHAQELSKEFDIAFEIYGFGLETGLPQSHDFRDTPFAWNTGFYEMDVGKLRRNLKVAQLVLGDVKDTVPTFFAQYDPAPLACVIFDLDYYTSTAEALRVFNGHPTRYLPRVCCYIDDIQTDYVGPLLAIHEFNAEHEDKKISRRFGLEISHWWSEKIFEFHDFRHPRYNEPAYRAIQQLPLTLT